MGQKTLHIRNPRCMSRDNPGCRAMRLAGNCCPAADGTHLACCDTDGSNAPAPGPAPPNPHQHIHKEKGPVKKVLYMYRAQQGYGMWEPDARPKNINLASPGGVMRYLHDEAVGKDVCGSCTPPLCERKYNISRIVRYKVTFKNTAEVYGERRGQFGPFRQFDNAKCTFGQCEKTWEKYGFAVGCQVQPLHVYHYEDAVWYSLPGSCPSARYGSKTDECKVNEPGGRCEEGQEPDGSRSCTFNIELAGEVALDDVVGLSDVGGYAKFCGSGGIEYMKNNEEASTIDFWKGFQDVGANRVRVEKLLKAFQDKYGEQYPALDTPACDGF